MKLNLRAHQRLSPAVACLALAACSTIANLTPFGSGPSERTIAPPDGTEYRCVGGKFFYMRYMDSNASAWVILADREFRLDRQGSAGRYTNGAAVLTVEGDTLALTDGPANSFSACKAAKDGKETKAGG